MYTPSKLMAMRLPARSRSMVKDLRYQPVPPGRYALSASLLCEYFCVML